MRRSSRLCAVFLLVLLLLPAALQAAEPLRGAPSALLSWDVLARVWSFLTGSQGDNGCEFDPDGRCRQHSTATSDNGCEFDPSGRCAARQVSPATVDNGCEADPNGRRCKVSAATVDNGCEFDPNGRCRN
jgi:hypothetical protein